MEDVQTFEETQDETEETSDASHPSINGQATAKTKSDDVPPEHKDEDGYARVEVDYAFGGDLDEAIEHWGEDFVFDLAASLFKRKLQNRMRRQLTEGVPPERVEENHSPENYDPTVSRRSSGDDVTDLMKKLNNLDEEEKAEVLEALNV